MREHPINRMLSLVLALGGIACAEPAQPSAMQNGTIVPIETGPSDQPESPTMMDGTGNDNAQTGAPPPADTAGAGGSGGMPSSAGPTGDVPPAGDQPMDDQPMDDQPMDNTTPDASVPEDEVTAPDASSDDEPEEDEPEEEEDDEAP